MNKLTSRNLKDLLKCRSKDEIKPNIYCINYNATEKRLEATNGHVLTTVPFDIDADKSFLIEADESFKCKDNEHLEVNKIGDDIITFAIKSVKSTKTKYLTYAINKTVEYPQVSRVIPEDDKLTHSVKLNLDLLPKGKYELRLEFAQDNKTINPIKAIDIDTKQEFVVMPMRN